MKPNEFKAVVERWYDPLYRFALSLCNSPDDALDLTQNAFQKLARSGSSLRSRAKAKSWLFSVVHREFIDDYRHAKRFPKTSFESIPSLHIEDARDRADHRLDAASALEALASLDPKFRIPLSLFYLEDFSYHEISETLNIPIGTVMSRLRRAKDHLRNILESPNRLPVKTNIQFSKDARNG